MAAYGKVISALLVGAAAGAVLGVLFAPDKGSETRRKIGKKTDDIIDQLSSKIDEGKEALSKLRRKAMETAEGKVGSVMEGTETARRTTTNASH